MPQHIATIDTNRGQVSFYQYSSGNIRAYPGQPEHRTDSFYASGDYIDIHKYDDPDLRPDVSLRIDEGGISLVLHVSSDVADDLEWALANYGVSYETEVA